MSSIKSDTTPCFPRLLPPPSSLPSPLLSPLFLFQVFVVNSVWPIFWASAWLLPYSSHFLFHPLRSHNIKRPVPEPAALTSLLPLFLVLTLLSLTTPHTIHHAPSLTGLDLTVEMSERKSLIFNLFFTCGLKSQSHGPTESHLRGRDVCAISF